MYIIHQRTETILREGLKEAVVSCYIFFVSNAALDVFYFEFFFFGALLSQLKDGLTDPVCRAHSHCWHNCEGSREQCTGWGADRPVRLCQRIKDNIKL